MKVLLLGKNGQLGFDLCRIIEEANSFELIALSRSDCDVSNFESIKKLRKIDFDVLINCTAYTNVEKAETQIADAFQANAYAVSELSKLCEEKKAKFIHYSTDYVFGDVKDKAPLTEADYTAPLNIYGASKLMGESLAQHYCSNTYILRSASLYGAKGASGKGGNFLTTILRIAKEKSEVSVVNDQWMSPTSTMSLAQISIDLINSSALPGIYHAVNSGACNWYAFAEEIMTLAGINCHVKPIASNEYVTKAVRPNYSALNNKKISGFVGEVLTWQQALKEHIGLYMQHEVLI